MQDPTDRGEVRHRRVGAAIVAAFALVMAVYSDEAPPSRAADISDQWTRTQTDVLSGFVNMYNPHIVYEPDSEYPFRMWFFGWASADMNPDVPGCDAIYHARARDLDHWEVYCGDGPWDSERRVGRWVPVLHAQNEFYDQWHNGDPSVVRHDGRYVMAYSSTGFDKDGLGEWEPGDTDLDISCVMAAASEDGIHWTRSKAPILICEPEIGERQDPLQDAAYTGMFHRPSLMWDEDRWRLWFDYWVAGPRGIGMGHAECHGDPLDPAAWQITNDLAGPLIPEWPNPDVVRMGDTYYCFADPGGYPGGTGWTSRQIAEAVSKDGLNWEVLGYIRPDDDTPACHVPEALVLPSEQGDRLILFYACQIGGEPYDYRYNRIRYMERR